jgi:hypothetical protein
MIKFWAFIYRLTGWYSPFAKAAERDFVLSQIKTIEKDYLSPDNDMSLETHIDICIGMWQANLGFYRRMK